MTRAQWLTCGEGCSAGLIREQQLRLMLLALATVWGKYLRGWPNTTTMKVHNRKKKFSHKVENIGTIYQRLKVYLSNGITFIMISFRTETQMSMRSISRMKLTSSPLMTRMMRGPGENTTSSVTARPTSCCSGSSSSAAPLSSPTFSFPKMRTSSTAQAPRTS